MILSKYLKNTKVLVALAIVAVILLLAGILFLMNEGEPEPEVTTQIGAPEARCGGPNRLPCAPGYVCDVPEGQFATQEGVCIPDTRPEANFVGEGEVCDDAGIKCGPGLRCVFASGASEGVCESLFESRPFIMSVIPEEMELVGGSYRAAPGTEVTVRVRAVNVAGGDLYLKPLTASHSGVMPEEKISPLTPAEMPNEYKGSFTVPEFLGADLIAVMEGRDGQEVDVSINVSSIE